MNTLTLSLKRKYFDEILAGTKTHEYRDVRPSSTKKYIHLLCEGKFYEDDDPAFDDVSPDSPVEIVAKKYDAIKFYTGAYSGKRPYMLIEMKDAEAIIMTDEKGDYIYLQDSNGEEYLAVTVDYTLGKILEVNENPE
ncbi:MAG: ASCH domain-containing protein [Paramuribaculum sp.]|nr:ASCH domain-containing protein [Paramuribaculum sp.]